MNKIILPLDISKLERPGIYEPDWFKMSSSMSDAYSTCREKIVWQYVYHVKKKLMNFTFLRRNTVIFAARQMFMSPVSADPSDNVKYLLKSEAKDVVDYIGKDWDEWTKEHLDPIETALRLRYAFPPPENKWAYCTFDQFLDQCIGMANDICEYAASNVLVPLELVEDGHIVQKTMSAPLVSSGGEILDETGDNPTVFRAQINLFTKDKTLYVWKMSNKKSSKKDMPAHISESVDVQCAVLAHHLGHFVDFPMKVVVCKAIINKRGEHTSRVLEEHTRYVTQDEVERIKRKLAIKAQDIKAMRLFKERSWQCPQCDYYDVCIRGVAEDSVVEFYGIANSPYTHSVGDDDDDAMPF